MVQTIGTPIVGNGSRASARAVSLPDPDMTTSQPRKRMDAGMDNLAHIAWDALRIQPPLYASAILGHPWTWIPPYRPFSEFGILNLWRPRRTIRFLLNVTIPSIPRTPPPFGPPLLNDLFWQPTVILQRPDHIGSYTSFLDESWFLINGIMTNDAVAQINAAYVSYLFHRPVTLVQNSTDSFVVDMIQCMLGKEWYRTTEPAVKAFPVIYDALKDAGKRRVVILAHSQGTIIVANVLRLLYAITQPPEEDVSLAAAPRYAPPEFIYPEQEELRLGDFAPLTIDELARLEVYCFATCANRLTYFAHLPTGEPVPWIEHFGNEYDIVARLGMQAPHADQWGVDIAGPRYVRRGAWGHLLNAHYLFAVADYQKSGRRRGGIGSPAPFIQVNPDAAQAQDGPRLFQYINGG